jgi:hypothetical protein
MMVQRSIFVGSAIVVGGIIAASAFNMRSQTSARFDAIFNRGEPQSPLCYDRIKFKQSLQHSLSFGNPVGIIFVTGRLGAGKSTLIHSVLSDRIHVADVNWRGKTIRTKEELNQTLKDAFDIKSYKDQINEMFGSSIAVKMGVLGNLYRFFFPSISFEEFEKSNLESTMNDIEKVLRFAKVKGGGELKSRPVIFIDEIQALRYLAHGSDADREVAKSFVTWLIRISRDFCLCDVVFASHDGFAMEILQLADPAYCAPIVVPNFSKDDMKVVGQSFPRLTQSMSNSIYSYVAGHAEHVKRLVNVTSKSQMKTELDSVRHSERQVLKEILNKNASSCTTWFRGRNFSSDCCEKEDFIKVMDLLAESKDKDPEIAVDTVIRQTKVNIQALRILSHHRLIFYNPGNETISARNKLSLTLYKEKHRQQAEIESLEADIAFEKERRDDEEVSSEHRENAAKNIKEAEEKLAQLEKIAMLSRQSKQK